VVKKDFINFASLVVIQISNAALPLVVFPLALRVVGAGPYATLVQAEAMSALVLALVLYSFDVDGVVNVVRARAEGDHAAISRTFSTILLARIGLHLVCLLAIAAAFAIFQSDFLLALLCWLLVPLSHALQSSWLFQALEDNAPLALVTAMNRTTALALVLLLVHGPDDVLLVPALVGSCAVIGAIVALTWAMLRFKLRLALVPIPDIARTMAAGRQVFLGNLSVALYRDLNVLVLGLAGARDTVVAAYSVAEKLMKCLQAVARPLNQLFFPRVLLALVNERRPTPETLRQILRHTYPQLWIFAAIALLVVVAGGVAVGRIAVLHDFPGRDTITLYLAILLLAPFFGIGNFMLGTAGLNALGERRYLFRSILGVGLANLAVCFFLAATLGGIGVSICFVLAEAALLWLVVRRFHGAGVR
jgi:polysaccharide transporter, PST family